MGRARRHSHGFLSAFLLVTFSLPAHALAPPVTPVGLRHIQKAGSVLNGRVTYQIGLGQAATYVERGLSFGGGTMGALAKGALKGGLYGVALTGFLDGLGWAWDALNEEVETGGDPGGYECEAGTYDADTFSNAEVPISCDPSSQFALFKETLEVYYIQWFNFQITTIEITSGSLNVGANSDLDLTVYYITDGGNGSPDSRPDHVYITYHPSGTATQPATPSETVSTQTLGDQVIAQGEPQLWEDLLTDPATGMPVTTPEIQQERWDIQKEQVEQAGGDPETVPEPEASGSAELVESEEAPETDRPAFCTWASIVCDWADWQQETPEEPESPELPLVDVPIPSDWDAGLGTSACPAASTVTLWNDTVVEIPWQPACDGADILRPILLAMAYFIAAGILVGRRT